MMVLNATFSTPKTKAEYDGNGEISGKKHRIFREAKQEEEVWLVHLESFFLYANKRSQRKTTRRRENHFHAETPSAVCSSDESWSRGNNRSRCKRAAEGSEKGKNMQKSQLSRAYESQHGGITDQRQRNPRNLDETRGSIPRLHCRFALDFCLRVQPFSADCSAAVFTERTCIKTIKNYK
jgi:hypothetical protein